MAKICTNHLRDQNISLGCGRLLQGDKMAAIKSTGGVKKALCNQRSGAVSKPGSGSVIVIFESVGRPVAGLIPFISEDSFEAKVQMNHNKTVVSEKAC